MATSRNRLNAAVLVVLSAMGINSILPNQAKAANVATQQYYDVNGTGAGFGYVNNTTYDWDSAFWTSTSTGLVATGAYHNDGTYTTTSFPRFNGTNNGDTYTITVPQTEYFAGMYLDPSGATGFGVTLNINQAPTTSGNLNVPGVPGTPDGVFIRRVQDHLVLNVPVAGTGGMSQSGAGDLSLFGNNSFSGGFNTTGGQTTFYNNANSFGTSLITFTGTSGQGFVNSAGSAVTIANNITWGTIAGVTNFVSGSVSGAPGTIFSGPVALVAGGSVTFQAGNAATDITQFSNNISGAGSLNITGSGAIIFSGANGYTGATTLTAGTLKLGAANTIAHTSQVVANGGKLDPGGFNQAMAATLKLTLNSTIDYGSGIAELDFADSHSVAWTASKILNLANFNWSFSTLKVGTTGAGLTSAQLAEIEFNGDASTLGKAVQLSDGRVVPEPASLSLLGLGATMLIRRKRRA